MIVVYYYLQLMTIQDCICKYDIYVEVVLLF